MALSSLLGLIDDLAGILDDVALLTKVAARKTTAVLGDDLALNAQQVAGVQAERELPVVWAVAKGSLRNKAILVPAALAISAATPWLVTPLLMAGGAYLCYEGFEKVSHWLRAPRRQAHPEARLALLADPAADLAALERGKIKGAVRTDFILSAEIVTITLGTVAGEPFATRVLVLAGIALVMTAGVYGLVAAIVKLDDLGLHLHRNPGQGPWARAQRALGAGILKAAPHFMKVLALAGTAAMFLVGGGIITHGSSWGHGLLPAVASGLRAVPGGGPLLGPLAPSLVNGAVGMGVGAFLLVAATVAGRAARRWRRPASGKRP